MLVGIQMKRKELTKTCLNDDFKLKKPFGLLVYIKYFRVLSVKLEYM